MGWHFKHGGSGLGSGCGWSFDPQLFPNATQFLGKLKQRGLHMGMNVHDCGGVCADEPLYAEAAKHVGIDPATKAPITAQWCTNPKFAYALGDIVNKGPLDQGADFYWNDWACSGPTEQGHGDTSSGCKGGRSTPSYWTNRNRHTFHRRQNIAKGNTDATSDPSETRGFVMGRWGGMGSHRYPHGFSGDVVDVNWQTVAYQPYFTATAGNVLFGYWSHDLLGVQVGDNGHNKYSRAEAMELHVRILQWGAWSPVFRTHDRGASAGEWAPSVASVAGVASVLNESMRILTYLFPLSALVNPTTRWLQRLALAIGTRRLPHRQAVGGRSGVPCCNP
jgi:alpha-glucosidase (family GH31 glycosyl hydrolase)